MSESILGIDVSKNTLDVSIEAGGKARHRQFPNATEGHKALLAWLEQQKCRRVHACLETTGHYSLGIALALHEAGHIVSLINPAQIKHFGRSKLGRNKTDKADCALIREFGAKFAPPAWTPPSPALRRLCELRTIRSGFIASRVEWQNRLSSGMQETTATELAQATIKHFEVQIAAIDKAIAETIDGDDDLSKKRKLLLSIDGVGETLAATILAELPGSDTITHSAQVAAYAGLNPRQHQSGTSINQPTRISKIGNEKLRTALFMPAMVAMRYNEAIIAFTTRLRKAGRLSGKQIVIAAMRKLLIICFGVLKSGKPFDAKLAMPKGA